MQEDEAHRLAEHLVIARRLIAERRPTDRAAMARQLVTDRYEISWSPAAGHSVSLAPQLANMRRQILSWEPDLARSDLRLRLSALQPSVVTGELKLDDGSIMGFQMRGVTQGWTFAVGRVLLALAPALFLLILSALMIRLTLRPLRALMRATRQVGLGTKVPVAEAGPPEIRDLIHAFNQMQSRIHDLIESRTVALAAVGHDLRTPLARLQLRLDDACEPQTRDAMGGDIAEMEAMIASLLAFLSGDDDPEEIERADIAILVGTLVDDARDRGQDASYDGPVHCEMLMRRSGIRRAIGNLIENALHYGKRVRVILRREADSVLICVDDDGPGIPAASMEEVLRPFSRLDTARQRNTKGLGLGLAIVARVIGHEGGTLELSNREEGGLRAKIRLPLIPTPAQ